MNHILFVYLVDASHLIRFRTTDNNGNGEGIEREVAVDVPKYRYAGRDEFENPWHLRVLAT